MAVVERIGRIFGFSPEGRAVRVWVRGAPGGEETEVVGAVVEEVRSEAAVVRLERPVEVGGRLVGRVLALPHERGWGLAALWFSFIAVDAFELGGEEPVGRWFVRLGDRRGAGA